MTDYVTPYQDAEVIAWLESAGVDPSMPSPDRIYDAYLGGSYNTAVDRAFVEQAEQILPSIKALARNNRSFLRRAVRSAVDAGIDQFLDIGSGAPTVGNVHDIALRANPNAHVVYVDSNTIACQTSRIKLTEQGVTDRVTIIQQDFRDPLGILEHPATRSLIDFSRPVCVLMVALLHFVSDDDRPGQVITRYRDHLAPGSKLALSHICSDEAPPEEKAQIAGFLKAYENTTTRLYIRSRAELETLFAGWKLERPGVVHPQDWRPDGPADHVPDAYYLGWCGVGSKI
ncbi:MAG: SAM-dependent methyltransferase [Kibdelosporangium sp.]